MVGIGIFIICICLIIVDYACFFSSGESDDSSEDMFNEFMNNKKD